MGFQGLAQNTRIDTLSQMGGDIQTKIMYGNLIIQTIPNNVFVEIPKLSINEDKKQDSLIFDEIYTGLYDLTFSSKQDKFKCIVEVLNKETVHLLVNVKGKSFEKQVIDYTPSEEEEFVDTDLLYVMVENMPEFPGGARGLREWIRSNVKYPEIARRNKVTGRVYVGFVIDKVGKVGEVKVLRSINPVLDSEALRVVESMPVWKPGVQKGKPVRVSYTFPINFQLR
jgi:TonB family protein